MFPKFVIIAKIYDLKRCEIGVIAVPDFQYREKKGETQCRGNISRANEKAAAV